MSIDTNKLSRITRNFFASECVTSIALREITDVTLESTLFLAQMSIKYAHLSLRVPPLTIKISALPKYEAVKAKEIIQGIIVLLRENVDITTITSNQITEKLQQIGKI